MLDIYSNASIKTSRFCSSDENIDLFKYGSFWSTCTSLS